jgi:hypothetical protein
MPAIKVACWNIYYSDRLIENGQIKKSQKKRADNVGKIIQAIGAHILGIVECMPENKLKTFRDKYSGGHDILVEGNKKEQNIGIIFDSNKVEVSKVNYDKGKWYAQIGDDQKKKKYAFSRKPLIVKVTPKIGNKKAFIIAVVHQKSKKTYTASEKEPFNNRKKIIAQGMRLRKILFGMLQKKIAERFIIMGDINDGPGFDSYEAGLLKSGVEAHIGTVLEPDTILHSFVDLSDGIGTPTHTFKSPMQIDHMLYPHNMAHGSGKPKVNKNSGRVRSDLVDITKDGKKRDSDHAPIELIVNV